MAINMCNEDEIFTISIYQGKEVLHIIEQTPTEQSCPVNGLYPYCGILCSDMERLHGRKVLM